MYVSISNETATLPTFSTGQMGLRASTTASLELRQPASDRDRWYVFLHSHGPANVSAVHDLVADYCSDLNEEMPLPITTFEGEDLSLEWSTASRYLQAEIRGGRVVEWYARDFQTRHSESGSGPVGLIEQIRKFRC
jgi:hypothetical protein